MIYLTTKTCMPCKTLKPKIKKICDDVGEPFVVVDIEDNPHAVPDGVTSVPTLILSTGAILTGPQVNPLTVRKVLNER